MGVGNKARIKEEKGKREIHYLIMHTLDQIYEAKVIRLFGNITLHNVVKKAPRIYGGENEYLLCVKCLLWTWSFHTLFQTLIIMVVLLY